MYYYVTVTQMHRKDWLSLVEWLESSGAEEADYHTGGWGDSVVSTVLPRLRFTKEEDAIAFVLARGGKYTTEMPMVIPHS